MVNYALKSYIITCHDVLSNTLMAVLFKLACILLLSYHFLLRTSVGFFVDNELHLFILLYLKS